MSRAHRSAALHRGMERHREQGPAAPLGLGRPVPEGSAAAWFLGPKAENEELLRALVDRALAAHAAARRDFHPEDPRFAPQAVFDSPRFAATTALLRERLDEMLAHLRGSIPLASYRNQSHMYWDVTLPGLVGTIAALLYNQNNVAAEASPVTTLLEMAVGNDLCRMLGFGEAADAPRPWGHITCDGSVANAEALWAARNLKYLPLALAAAIREEPAMAAARGVTLRTHAGRRRLLDLDAWALLNLPVAEALALSPRIAQVAGLAPAAIAAALAGRSVQDVGLLEFHRRHLPDTPSPVVLAPATAHYSWPKGAALLGLGRAALRPVRVDLDGRMDPVALRAMLDACLDERRPVLAVVAVIGTTEESAVDPLAEIAAARDEYAEMGLGFALHADAAWGGYFAAMLRPPRAGAPEAAAAAPELETWERGIAPGMPLSDHVAAQYRALPCCDSITVDPHKAGFIPYPAGALCYRDGAMRDVVSFTAPVVYHDGVVPSVGVYGIEGSKPGAAAAAVWLSHAVIPADQSGYGRLLARCVFTSKRFYAALLAEFGPGDPVAVTPFQRLPAERAGGTAAEVDAERDRLRRDIVPLADAALVARLRHDPALLALFRGIGSDQSIVAYALNFRSGGALNACQALMNELNQAIFMALSVQEFTRDRLPRSPAFVTASAFDPAVYGQDFVDHFARRAGVAPQPGLPLHFLISTQQNPFLTSTAEGDFTPRLMAVLRETATAAAEAVRRRHGLAA